MVRVMSVYCLPDWEYHLYSERWLHMKNKNLAAVLYALLAALFYAVNVPCSKLLLGGIPPAYMAACLYMGAGVGVGVMYFLGRHHEKTEEKLGYKDLPYTVGMVLLDIAAPVLLMFGISMGTSANASLLGNFEIVATSVIAFGLFREKVSKQLWVAIGFITLSSIILSFGGSGSIKFSFGSLLVLGATICWGFENNCTKSISSKSAYQIVTIKGLFSGMGSFIIAVVRGEKFPKIGYILIALVLGFVAYGLSIFTYIRAQKTLGAAKTSAYYAVAPFIGGFLSFILLKEPLSIRYGIAMAVMIVGTLFAISDTLSQKHTHVHIHTVRHTHDGISHTHMVSHVHEHSHYFTENKHGHHHSYAELEKSLGNHSFLN